MSNCYYFICLYRSSEPNVMSIMLLWPSSEYGFEKRLQNQTE